jgi:NAD+ kinase
MKKILILGNKEKDAVRDARDSLVPWLSERADVTVDLDMSHTADGGFDFAIVLGGDGSVLAAARKLAPHGVPLVGVNVGKFGFLTETTLGNLRDVLGEVLDGQYAISERMMIQCALERNGEEVLSAIGLNDVVVSRGALSRLITLDLEVDGEKVTTYRADGLIVATPVGSTAHSLAAGGPILCPELHALIITPICPHTLSNRPIVLPGCSGLTLAVQGGAERSALTVDGQVNRELVPGDRVRVSCANEPLKLITTGRHTFFDTLRNKLDWRGQPRYVKDV